MKSHYRKHECTPMIVMKSYHRGFYIPDAERSVNGCALSQRKHIRCIGREAATFPFTSNTTISLARATLPTPTLRNARSIPARAALSPRRSRRAAPIASPVSRGSRPPTTAAAAAGFTGNRHLTTPSACVCATSGGVNLNQQERKENDMKAKDGFFIIV